MEITSFVLGVLTVIGVILMTLIVVGMFKINKQEEQIRNLQKNIESVEQCSDRDTQSLEEHMYQHIDEIRREYSSHVDSRVDKLQERVRQDTDDIFRQIDKLNEKSVING